jgi:L-ascorbate metabolism protein UlaG (beta-lactamase superfamily)
MSVEITWIGHASFRLASQGSVVYIDPWKLKKAPHDADVVIVSHSHHDHCSPEDIAKVSKDATAIVAPAETIRRLGAASALAPGETFQMNEVTVEAVWAYNIDKAFHPRGNNWIGAVITIGGVRVYYAGDTDEIPEMSELTDVDVALLPVGGTYTLNAKEAAKACEAIRPKAAIPYHWGDIVGSPADAEAFAKAASCKVFVLQPGQAQQF